MPFKPYTHNPDGRRAHRQSLLGCNYPHMQCTLCRELFYVNDDGNIQLNGEIITTCPYCKEEPMNWKDETTSPNSVNFEALASNALFVFKSDVVIGDESAHVYRKTSASEVYATKLGATTPTIVAKTRGVIPVILTSVSYTHATP